MIGSYNQVPAECEIPYKRGTKFSRSSSGSSVAMPSHIDNSLPCRAAARLCTIPHSQDYVRMVRMYYPHSQELVRAGAGSWHIVGSLSHLTTHPTAVMALGYRCWCCSSSVLELVPSSQKKKNRKSPHHHQTHVSAIPHLPSKSVIPNPVAIHPKIPLIGRESSPLKLDCKQKQVAFWGHT